MTPYDTDLLVKLLIAAVLGALIGYERQRYRKPAGMRTQMLICVGSTLLTGLSIDIALMHTLPGALSRPDPARLMAQIVAGIGFIGAGVILKGNDRISGVTTAATIWLTAAVGIAVGSGFYLVAASCVAIALLSHPMSKVKHKVASKNDAFIVKAPRADWLKTVAIAEELPLEYQVVYLSPKTCELRVFATKEIKQELLEKLDAKQIAFEFIEKTQ